MAFGLPGNDGIRIGLNSINLEDIGFISQNNILNIDSSFIGSHQYELYTLNSPDETNEIKIIKLLTHYWLTQLDMK